MRFAALCVFAVTAAALVATPVAASIASDSVPPVGAPVGICNYGGGISPKDCDGFRVGNRVCEWNYFIEQCMPGCDSSSAGGYECAGSWCRTGQPGEGGCAYGCPWLYNNATACFEDRSCTWDHELGVCRNSCARYQTENACNADSACEFNSATTSCEVSCWGHSIPTVCNADPRCSWNNHSATEFDSSMPHCAGRTPAPPTTTTPPPTPAPPVTPAPPPTCEGQTEEYTCDRLSFCMWNGYSSVCQGKCELKLYEQLCTQQSSCVWYFDTSTCDKGCSFHGWHEAECNAQPRCSWDATYASCDVNCSKVTTNTECFQTSNCVWLDSESRCYTPCSGYDGPAGCNNNPNCVWSWNAVACESYDDRGAKTSAQCAKHRGKRGDCILAGCRYNTEANTCLRQ